MMEKSICERIKPMASIGMAIIRRFDDSFCGTFSQSASVRRAERKAVSPEVIGQAITPSIARIAPMLTPPTPIAPMKPLQTS